MQYKQTLVSNDAGLQKKKKEKHPFTEKYVSV
jgi:hypothetical protein